MLSRNAACIRLSYYVTFKLLFWVGIVVVLCNNNNNDASATPIPGLKLENSLYCEYQSKEIQPRTPGPEIFQES